MDHYQAVPGPDRPAYHNTQDNDNDEEEDEYGDFHANQADMAGPKDRDLSSPGSSYTSASPSNFLSLAGATGTPLSMSVDSSDLQYPPDDEQRIDRSAEKNMQRRISTREQKQPETEARIQEEGPGDIIDDGEGGIGIADRNASAYAACDPGATPTAVPDTADPLRKPDSPARLSETATPTVAASRVSWRWVRKSTGALADAATNIRKRRSSTKNDQDEGQAQIYPAPVTTRKEGSDGTGIAKHGGGLAWNEDVLSSLLSQPTGSTRLRDDQAPPAGTPPGTRPQAQQAKALALAAGEGDSGDGARRGDTSFPRRYRPTDGSEAPEAPKGPQQGPRRAPPSPQSGTRSAPPQQGQSRHPLDTDVADAAAHASHAPPQAGRQQSAPAPGPCPNDTTSQAASPLSLHTTHSAHTTHHHQQQQHQPGREDDSAEITSVSRSKGHAGSTPLSLFTSPNKTASPKKTSKTSKPSKLNTTTSLDTRSLRLSSPTAEKTSPTEPSHPASPVSLAEQIHETLQKSCPSSPVSARASATVHAPKPIVRTTSDSKRFRVRHPVPDLNTRSGAYAGNIAALEKTAERLSMTSSFDEAIRDLHGELKRSDSQRSSVLAAGAREREKDNDTTASSPIDPPSTSSQLPSLSRHRSAASSILEVNNAARTGGYSPAGYVMSPNNSLTGRLRSTSKGSAGRPDLDVDPIMSRSGPGKGSTRSVRSSKPSLAEIAETEPAALNSGNPDNAAHLPVPHEEDLDHMNRTTRDTPPATESEPLSPNTDAFHRMLDDGPLHRPPEDIRLDYDIAADKALAVPGTHPEDDNRPSTARSTNTLDVGDAFGDFDGVHCPPDFDFENMPEPEMPEPQTDGPDRGNLPRPESYYDQESGQHMMFYPARVPAMLNLPPKLSRKPKAALRNARHSKVLEAMGHPGLGQPEYMPRHPDAPSVRESKLWLPDPVVSDPFAPFSFEASADEPHAESSLGHERSTSQDYLGLGRQDAAEGLPQPPPVARSRSPRNEEHPEHAPSSSQDLPAQLRASAFFELPSTTPQVEVKSGSAMATLDSILDASASAPVDAFTGHSFAGKLGHEVYGREKRLKNRKSAATIVVPAEAPPERPKVLKKRISLFPFGRSRDAADEHADDREGGDAAHSTKGKEKATDEESQSLTSGVDGKNNEDVDGKSDGAEDEDEFEEEALYEGQPTTLLAELQLRKQQQKLRTANQHLQAPGGMHSTLLELDAVAETQHKSRKNRRVNLAWEDPSSRAGAAGEEESDDEDVPLGLLYAARASGNNDISAAAAELNRPIGLMERREIEENEPLSARRARLQGHEPVTLANRRSMMALNPHANTTRLSRMPSPQRPSSRFAAGAAPGPASEQDQDPEQPRDAEPVPEEPEVEGETLGERMRRLRTKEEAEHNNLPRARPVSSTFSVELLSTFDDLEDQERAKEEEKAREKERERDENLSKGSPGGGGSSPASGLAAARRRRAMNKSKSSLGSISAITGIPPSAEEEDETLGQRRKRLQAEREAREREMSMNALNGGGGGGGGGAGGGGAGGNRPGLAARRSSLADTLNLYPQSQNMQQAEAEQRRRAAEEEERQRKAREKDAKMAAMRAQMPKTIEAVNGGNKAGGFRGGTYNDGTGGAYAGRLGGGVYGGGNGMNASRASFAGLGQGQQQMQGQQMQGQQMQGQQMQGQEMMGGGGGMGMGMGMGMNGYGQQGYVQQGYVQQGYGQQGYGAGMPMGMGMNGVGGMGGMGMNGMAMGGQPGMAGGMGMGTGTGMNMNMNMPMQSPMPMPMQMPMQMQMPGQPGQMSSIERWRQSVMP